MANPDPGTKYCSRCKLTFALIHFADQQAAPDGKQAWCRYCRREYDLGRRLALKNSREVEL